MAVEKLTLAHAQPRSEYVFVSDVISPHDVGLPRFNYAIPLQTLPTLGAFKDMRTAYVFGRLHDLDAAVQLAGILLLAQDRYGTKIVFAYASHLSNADR